MNEQNTVASTSSSKKTILVVIATIVLVGAGWFFMRGGVVVDKNMAGSPTYSNNEESVTVDAKSYPDNWPTDAPKYANGQITSAGSYNQETGQNASIVSFVTSDSFQKVADFYKNELVSKGWKVEEIRTMIDVGSIVVSGKRGSATFSVQVSSTDGKKTTATVVVQN